MLKNENLVELETITIGKEIAVLRLSINHTQERFADLLLVSRGTVSKLENAKEVDELANDILYRLCYVTYRIMNSQHKEHYVRELAESIHSKLDTSLQKRIHDQKLSK